MLSGRGVCDKLITRPEESYRLCCVVVCDLETSRMGAPYIYDISRLRVNVGSKSLNVIFILDAETRVIAQYRRLQVTEVTKTIISTVNISP